MHRALSETHSALQLKNKHTMHQIPIIVQINGVDNRSVQNIQKLTFSY